MLPDENEPGISGEKRPSDDLDQHIPSKRKNSQSNHQRALKACEGCRKGKTKCFKSSSVAVRCVRCTSAKLVCSLEIEYKRYNPDVAIIDGIPEHLLDAPEENASFPVHFIPKPDQTAVSRASDAQVHEKLDLIYRGVADILTVMSSKQASSGESLVNNDVRLLLDAAHSMKAKSDIFSSSILVDSLPQDSLNLFSNGVSRSGFPSANMMQFPTLENPMEKFRGDFQTAQSDNSLFSSSSRSFKVSPLNMISHSMRNVPRPIANLLNLSTVNDSYQTARRKNQSDLITCGTLSETEAIALMDDFRSNYGRWVSFPIHISTKVLVSQIRRKSSLLLSTCCALSLRYSLNGKPSPGDIDNHRRKKDMYKAVLKQLVDDLNRSLLKQAAYSNPNESGGDVEFLQSMVILSIYSLSLSSVVANTVDPESLLDEDAQLECLNLDPWYLSGLGLSNFITNSTFGSLVEGSGASMSPQFIAMYDEYASDDSQLLTLLRIYNHLILIHLVSCVLSGRMCLVDEIRLNYCTSTLSLPSATNFDGRMVSEIGILLITYNFLQINSNSDLSKGTDQLEANLESVNAEIKAWYEQWEYLFDQPALQFGVFSYNFCRLQIAYNHVFYKSQANTKSKQASKFNAEDFCDTNNLRQLLDKAEDADLSKILQLSYEVTHFVSKVENDSYFAYLSDQIHFFFFYGAMSLIILLKFLHDNNKLDFLESIFEGSSGKKNLSRCLQVVTVLEKKFERISQENPHDIITKYRHGIRNCVTELFPNI